MPKRFWQRLDKKPGESPMVFQIFGNDPHKILSAAQNILQLEPDIIDINMGCSTRRVSGRGAGVGMMRDPGMVAETFRLLTHHLSIPITAKMRLGWEDRVNYLEVGRIVQDNGARLVALHGRVKEQKYHGSANWHAIATLKQTLTIPVIGNGDILRPADIDRMKAETGCDGVMIGRGAIGNPWLFSRQAREEKTIADLLAAMRLHAQEMAAYYGEKYGLIQFRKHLKQYVAGVPSLQPLLPHLLPLEELEPFLACLAQAEGWLPLGQALPPKTFASTEADNNDDEDSCA
jgi:tRNA-dihydrouridine synthase B